MQATLTLDGVTFFITTRSAGDIRFHLPDNMTSAVNLSPRAVQLLAEALQYAVYETMEPTNDPHH